MKRTYQNPEISVTNIELQQMIANSPFSTNAQGELTGTFQDENAGSAAMGRGSSWDDED